MPPGTAELGGNKGTDSHVDDVAFQMESQEPMTSSWPRVRQALSCVSDWGCGAILGAQLPAPPPHQNTSGPLL